MSAVFSPDGNHVVTASADGTARIWDVATGATIAVLKEQHDSINSAAFSPDGSRAVTASRDHAARVWDISITSLAAIYTERAMQLRDLTEAERSTYGIVENTTDQFRAAAEAEAVDCDRLAANPFDPARVVAGLSFDSINADAAIAACKKAVGEAPVSPGSISNWAAPLKKLHNTQMPSPPTGMRLTAAMPWRGTISAASMPTAVVWKRTTARPLRFGLKP